MATACLYWEDRDRGGSAISDHDWVTHEHHSKHFLTWNFGPVLVAECDY